MVRRCDTERSAEMVRDVKVHYASGTGDLSPKAHAA
jgi:hypothetical protein